MDQTRLAKVLGSLTLEDGKPDVFARRKELDNLLPTLSNHEIRRFREQLNNVTMQMDICSQLPVEILLNVASHLELEDIFTLRAVSQSWHVNFSNPDFCLGIIQKHFPYAWEQFANAKSIAGGEDSKKKRLLKWFQAAAMARRRRLHGRYHSTSTYYYNYTKANELTPEEQLERQYNNGKVAFRTRQSGILTRDLRTGQTSRFLEVNRKPIQEWLLLDQYLVASTISPNTVCAWSLADNDQIESIRLPNRLLKLSGRADQVGIVTATEEILLWTIGGPLKSIDTSDYMIRPKASTTNVFFPKDSRHIFVTCQNDTSHVGDGEENALHLSINEYDLERKPTTAYNVELSPRYLFMARMTPVLTGRKIVWRLNPDFTYTMTSKNGSNCAAQSTCQHVECRTEMRSVVGILLITFDIYTKEFSFQTYHLPSHLMGLQETFFWNEQAILPVVLTYKPIETHPVGIEDILLLAVNTCDNVGRQPRSVPWYGKEGSHDRSIVFSPQENWASLVNVAWCWVEERNHSRGILQLLSQNEYDQPDHGLVQISGDEDFIVLFGRENGMVVWCFDESVDMSVLWTQLDPAVSDDLKSRHPLAFG